MLDTKVNYIVSGLERSGTSMMMQMLVAAGMAVAFDGSRPSDVNNPKGYFELEGGKIINRLMDGTFPFVDFRGRFVKITAFGLRFLPKGQYCVIYMERDLDEILDSMEKMMGKNDVDRDSTKASFFKLNESIKQEIKSRDDVQVLFVNYNEIFQQPDEYVQRIVDFLGLSECDKRRIIQVIDPRLYRQRKKS